MMFGEALGPAELSCAATGAAGAKAVQKPTQMSARIQLNWKGRISRMSGLGVGQVASGAGAVWCAI